MRKLILTTMLITALFTTSLAVPACETTYEHWVENGCVIERETRCCSANGHVVCTVRTYYVYCP